MSDKTASIDALRQEMDARIAGYRQELEERGEVSLQGFDEKVRSYCRAIAELPEQEGQAYQADLQSLMQAVSGLGQELAAAREEVLKNLQALEHMKNANIAYHKTNAIGYHMPKPKVEKK